ncbi:type II toxin-antitoxin system Phd/YefM family antitoxin [Polaromonas sp.]|uniref:type II toxin-antitoxin system Phd/YefM family antitoxin n=1 Tax=Polaromonas sp. TaxID=1869339 RepID=UPI003752ACCB
MPHQSISLREANQNFSRVIAAVERGEVFSITRRGESVARLTPWTEAASASSGASAAVAIPMTDAELAERMRRLEILVDKLLSALSVPDTK